MNRCHLRSARRSRRSANVFEFGFVCCKARELDERSILASEGGSDAKEHAPDASLIGTFAIEHLERAVTSAFRMSDETFTEHTLRTRAIFVIAMQRAPKKCMFAFHECAIACAHQLFRGFGQSTPMKARTTCFVFESTSARAHQPYDGSILELVRKILPSPGSFSESSGQSRNG